MQGRLSSPCYQCTGGWPFHPISKLWQPNVSAKSAWQTPQISQHLWHHYITLQNLNISKIDPMWCRRLSSRMPQQLSEIGRINFPCTYNTTSISHGSGMGSKEVHLQSCKPSKTQWHQKQIPGEIWQIDRCVWSWINESFFQYPWITQHACHLPLPPSSTISPLIATSMPGAAVSTTDPISQSSYLGVSLSHDVEFIMLHSLKTNASPLKIGLFFAPKGI